jgi:vacuolar-type H+-ATPase subunit I/STV1
MTDLLTDKEENALLSLNSDNLKSTMLLSQPRLLMSTELNVLLQELKLKITKPKEKELLRRRKLRRLDLKRSDKLRMLSTLKEKENTKLLLLPSKLLKLSLLSKAKCLPQPRSNS